MDCPNFVEGGCTLAANLAGIFSATTAPACSACSRNKDPRAVNSVTVSLACSALRNSGDETKWRLLAETYQSLLLVRTPLPSWAEQGWSVTKAVAAFATRPGLVPVDEYRSRLAECNACEQRDDLKCTLCGCYIHAKAGLPREQCPVLKWDAAVAEKPEGEGGNE